MTINNYFTNIKPNDYCIKIAKGFSHTLEQFIWEKGHDIINYVNEKRKNNVGHFFQTHAISEQSRIHGIQKTIDDIFTDKGLCFILYAKMYELKFNNLNELMYYPNHNRISLDENAQKIMMEKLSELYELDNKDFNYLAERAGSEIISSGKDFFYKLMGERTIFERLESNIPSNLSNFS